MKYFLIFCLISALILMFYPELDIYFSKFFFKNGKFYLKFDPKIKFLHLLVRYISGILIGIYIISFLLNNIFRFNLFNLDNYKLFYLLLALIIGPGLVVNSIFKDNFGRARPINIKEFNGKEIFTPPFEISKACFRNCSFPSGHASIGFYFSSFGFVARKNRKLIIKSSIIFGLVLGIARIIQGGHFLSDVLFSGIMVLTINYLLYQIMFSYGRNKTSQIH